MRICSKCNEGRELKNFGKCKRSKDGFNKECKYCRREYYHKNKEYYKNRSKEYREQNKDIIKERKTRYWHENKEDIKKRREDYFEKRKPIAKKEKAKYYEDNKEFFKEKSKKYYESNKSKIKKYRKENSDRINKIKYKSEKKRIDSDPIFRLKQRIRQNIWHALKRNGLKKKSRTSEILGCDIEFFIKHLNNNKYNLKYEDGLCDLDHIIPISNARNEEEVYELNHYTNFQLLPKYYNRVIKRNFDEPRISLEDWIIKTKFYETIPTSARTDK